MKKTFLLFMLPMLGIGSANAATFSGGSGTEADPYLIATEDDLYDISTNLSAYYKLVNNLDLTEWIEDESPKTGWDPIGTSAKPFTGTFDGNGKTISGLLIKRTTTDYVGLFGYADGATIKQLTLDSPNVTGKNYCASLLGYGTAVSIADVSVNAAIVTGNNYSGAMNGELYGSSVNRVEIINPRVSASQYIGCLSGSLSSSTCGNITITGAVVNGGSSVGVCLGLVSHLTSQELSVIAANIVIENSSVTGSHYLGGVIGLYQRNQNTDISAITDATVRNIDVRGESYVGGVIGGYMGSITTSDKSDNISDITLLNGNVYASNNYAGGIIGYVQASQSKTSNVAFNCCYADCVVKAEEGMACGLASVEGTSRINNYNYTISKISASECIISSDVTCTNGYACGMTYIAPAAAAAGNIINESPIIQCIFMGSVSGKNVNGISYAWAKQSICYADQLSATASLYRIKTSTESAVNYSYNGVTLLLNGEETEVEDNVQNGDSKSARLLRRQNTYTSEEMGYDFGKDWAIVEGKSLPYLMSQSVPAEISSIVGGVVSGTATGSGKVYVFVGQTMYVGTVTDGVWEVSVGSLAEGTEVKVSVETEGKLPSVITKEIAGEQIVTPDGYDEVTLSSTYATYCSTSNLDFSGQTQLKAYAATGYEDGKVVLTRVSLVPAGEGVLLRGETGTYRVEHTDADSYFTNLLKGVTETVSVAPTTGDKTNFILANGSKGIGFYPIAETGPIAAGKAYLQLPTTLFNARGRMLNLIFDDNDESTGIADTKTNQGKGNFYDLQGRLMNETAIPANGLKKGLYIRDGKKIIIR